MSTQVKMSRIPNCDLCFHLDKSEVPAYADASLPLHRGTWAYVCRKHFEQSGCSLGTGRGQELVLG